MYLSPEQATEMRKAGQQPFEPGTAEAEHPKATHADDDRVVGVVAEEWRPSITHIVKVLEAKDQLQARLVLLEEEHKAAVDTASNLNKEQLKRKNEEAEIRRGFQSRIKELEETIKVKEGITGNRDAEISELKKKLEDQKTQFDGLKLEKARIEEECRVANERALAIEQKYKETLNRLNERKQQEHDSPGMAQEKTTHPSHQTGSTSTQEGILKAPDTINVSQLSSLDGNISDAARSHWVNQQASQQAKQHSATQNIHPPSSTDTDRDAREVADVQSSSTMDSPVTFPSAIMPGASHRKSPETGQQPPQHTARRTSGKSNETEISQRTKNDGQRVGITKILSPQETDLGPETKSPSRQSRDRGANLRRVTRSENISIQKRDQDSSQPPHRMEDDEQESLHRQRQGKNSELEECYKKIADLERRNAAALEKPRSEYDEKARLLQQLEEKKQELESIKLRNVVASEPVRPEDGDKARLRQQLEKKTQELDESRKELEELKLKTPNVEKLSRSLGDANKEYESLRMKFEEKDRQLVESNKTIQDLNRKITDAQSRLQSEEYGKASQSRKLENATKELDKLRSDIQQSQSARAALSLELKETTKELGELRSSAQQNQSALTQSETNMNERIATLIQQLKEREDIIATKSRTIQGLEAQYNKVTSDLAATQKSHEEYRKTESRALHAQQPKLHQEKIDNELKLQNLIQRANKEQEERNREKQKYEARIASMVRENFNVRESTNIAHTDQLAKLRSEYESTILKLESTIRNHLATIESKDVQIGQFPKQIQQIQKECELDVKKNEEELEKLKAVCEKAKQQVNEKTDEIERLEDNLKQSHDKMKRLEEEINTRQLQSIPDPTSQDLVSELHARIKSHKEREEDLQNRLDALTVNLREQESTVKEAQEQIREYVTKRNELQYDFIADNTARAKLHGVLQHSLGEWTKKYAPGVFDRGRNYNPLASLGLWGKLLGDEKKPHRVLQRYNPRVVLLALLVEHLVEKVISQPFVRLQTTDEGSTSQILAAEIPRWYADFLEVDVTGACSWRSQTLEMLFKVNQWQNKIRNRAQSTGVDENFQFPFSEILAREFIEGAANVLLYELDDDKDEKIRQDELANLIRDTAWVSTLLWKQRANLHFVYYDKLKNLRYSDRLKDITLYEQIAPEKIPKDGASVDMILLPEIRASIVGEENLGDEASRNTDKVWGDPLVVWECDGKQAINIFESDEESESDEGSEDVYPDTEPETDSE